MNQHICNCNIIGNGIPLVITTRYGGFAKLKVNDTGADSVEGNIVRNSTAIDFAVSLAPAGSDEPTGYIYNSGIPNGELVYVVFDGGAMALLEDGTSVTRGDWVGVSETVPGRVIASAEPPAPLMHDKEGGHASQSKASGTDVLFLLDVHFR